MAKAFTDPDVLANTLRPELGELGVVGIDGWTGVGKTTLGERLAKELGGTFFDLDCALTHDRKAYVSAIRISEVSEAFANQRRPLVVSGICLLEVLEKAAVKLDSSVYVKRMAAWGWADEDELRGIDFGVPGASGEPVREELRRYHQNWQPHLSADYEFQRTDKPSLP
ncbi:MAG: shikimate kinase [Pseudomonadota bacterium]